MKIWLITDTHLGHDAMIEYCGRPKDHSERILKNLSNTIKPKDLLIHLGDVCIGNEAEWHEKLMGATKNATHWLLRGNHDHKSNSWYLSHGWNFVGEVIKDTYFGKKILLSHMPQYWDGWYELNIHGHFHNSDHRRYEEELVWRKNGYQKLYAIEYTNLMPVTLEYFIK